MKSEEQYLKEIEDLKEKHLIEINEMRINLSIENEQRVDYFRKRWTKIANIVIETVGNVSFKEFDVESDEFKKLCDEFTKYVSMGKDFEVLLTAVRSHDTLMATWDDLLVTLKLLED